MVTTRSSSIRGGGGGIPGLGNPGRRGSPTDKEIRAGEGYKKSCNLPEGYGFFLELPILHRLHEIW